MIDLLLSRLPMTRASPHVIHSLSRRLSLALEVRFSDLGEVAFYLVPQLHVYTDFAASGGVLASLVGVECTWRRLLSHSHQILNNTLLRQISHISVRRLYAHNCLVQRPLDVESAQALNHLKHLGVALRGRLVKRVGLLAIAFLQVGRGDNFDGLCQGQCLEANCCAAS